MKNLTEDLTVINTKILRKGRRGISLFWNKKLRRIQDSQGT